MTAAQRPKLERVSSQLRPKAPRGPTLSPVLADVVLVLLSALLLALPTALLGVIRAVLYADTLIRREGVDLDARLAARIARRRSTAPPPAPAAPAQELI